MACSRHAAQLGSRTKACAAKDDCQGAAQRTEARHRESRGAHPYRVASNLRFAEDHARTSETWSRCSSQYGLANHARVRNPYESTVEQLRRVRTHMHRRQIFSSVTSSQTDHTRSGCAASLTFRRIKASSISWACWTRGAEVSLGESCRTRCMRRLQQMRSRWPSSAGLHRLA